MDYGDFESARIRFRRLTLEDVSSWLPFFEDKSCFPFLGIREIKAEEVMAKEWIERQIERYSESGLGSLACISKETGRLIGIAGIVPREVDGSEYCEIVYSLLPTKRGKGYATEIINRLHEVGEELAIASRFISIIHKDNSTSIRAAERCQMIIQWKTIFMGMPVLIYGR